MSNSRIVGGAAAYGDSMASYDKLPPSFRKALREADFDWAASTVLARWQRGHKDYRKDTIARTVKQWDRSQHKADVKRGLVAP